ncbi:hypothetical protein DFH28DRAFT_883088 [Melampsora americana]|nr:hypothetical protein DFH28DRAFT_883088 [Melampsora americana]
MSQSTSPTTLTTPAWNSVEPTELPTSKHSPRSWSSTSSHHSNLHQHSSTRHSEKSPRPSSSPLSPSPSSSSSSSHVSIHSQNGVQKFLKNLGLSEYIHTFLDEGFDTMISIEAITEDDLEHMSIKRGHRRVLQRALVARGSTSTKIDQTLPSQPIFSVHPTHLGQFQTEPHAPSESLSESGSGTINSNIPAPTNPLIEYPTNQFSIQQQSLLRSRSVSSDSTQIRTIDQENWRESKPSHQSHKTFVVSTPNFQISNPKRKYQRHPKPDLNAPEKPLSAYVMFSNQVREELKGQQISFTEIARLVGDRWKNLCPQIKESIVNRAAEAKNVWSLQMDQYKKTQEYNTYQTYVKEFKANHGKSKSSNRFTSSEIQPIKPSHQTSKMNSIRNFNKPEEMNKSEEEEEEEEEENEGEGEESYSESEIDLSTTNSTSSKRIKLSSIETRLPFLNILAPFNSHHHSTSLHSSSSVTNPMTFAHQRETNNTFFEKNPSRVMRLPVDLRHMTPLASSAASSKDSKV